MGVETVGTDAGQAFRFDPAFPCHTIMHGSNRFGLASLTNLDKLPPTGAVVFAPPLKIVNGSVTNKIYLHLTVSMSGQKGDVMLTLAPDGNSFTGAGQLADGTAIAWTGQRASSAAQTQATDASRPRNKIDRLRKEISQNDQPT